jgi:MFS family permease
MLAQVVPGAQRGAIIAIDNSVASVAGAIAPLVSGLLIEHVDGARGFELGFALCGVLMIAGGLLGGMLVRPDRSARAASALAGPA